MIVDIATDLMIKALSTENYGTYLDYSFAILRNSSYETSDIKKIQKEIGKVRALRDEVARVLHNTEIVDPREYPVQGSMFDKAYPDMFKPEGQ